MEKLRYTKGPWRHETSTSATRIVGPENETIGAVYGGFVEGLEPLSNARLVAAAPIMLEYVEKMAGEGDREAREIIASLESPGPGQQ